MSGAEGSLSERIRALSPEKRRALEQALAAKRARAEGLAPSKPAETAGPVVLSSAQRRMWYLDRRDPGRAAYNVPLAVRLRGPVEPELVRRALAHVVERHAVLRTRYVEDAGDAVAIVEPANEAWRVVDLADLPLEDTLRDVDERAAADGLTPVDLATGPMRATLYRMAADDHVLHLVIHHIAIDGWSSAVLLSELEQAYRAFAAGRAPALPPVPSSYADYAREEQASLDGAHAAAASAFWAEALADAPDGVALPKTVRDGEAVDAVGTLPFGIDEPHYSAFKAFCRDERVSLFVGFLAVLKLVLARYTRTTDIVIGTEASVRSRAEHADLIGLFVNQLALRTDLAGEPGLAEACRRVSGVGRRAFAHQDLPFDRVVRALGRQGERQPLFNVVLSLRTQERAKRVEAAEAVRFEALPDGGPKTFAPKFDLAFSLVDDGARLGGAIEYDRRLYAPEAIAGLAEAIGRAVEAGLADPAKPFAQIGLGGAALLARERGDWNATARPLPETIGLHRVFEAAHDRDPEHPALVHRGETWSHARLESTANRLARRAVAAGAGPERIVVACVSRGPMLIAAVLAAMKAGAAILVLDPDQASGRWHAILADARPAVILADATGAALLPPVDAPVLDVDAAAATGDASRPDVSIEPDGLAYVIYTSGSTGTPKGVMGHHRGLTALAEAQAEAFGLTAADRVMQVSAITFDAFVWELALVWRAGATLVLAPDGAPQPDERFAALLRDERVTMMTIPPSVLGAMPDADLPDLRILVVAGEACPAALTTRFAAGRAMTNAYGPTETTVWASGEACVPGEAPAIGRPIANMRMHLVDAAMNPIPVGALGEIALAGPAVTRGYLGRPGATAERFRPDPFSDDPGARMYLTGDLGCRLPDGRVRYHGRIDDQVKIRGFRVEPGEAQAALAHHPGVAQVVVRALPHEGRDRLVAWWTPSGEPTDEASLRAHAAAHLPMWLRPSSYVRLDAMPLTPHGKIDRRALPAPETQAPSPRDAGAPPREGVESRLAAVWAEVLGIGAFGRDDNFFELGGDSIISVRLVSRARTAGLGFTAVQLFAHPTVAGLAPHVETVVVEAEAAQAARGRELALSPLQEGLLFHCLRRPDLPLYVQRFRLRVAGPLDPDRLERAWNRLIARHQALRTRFVLRGRETPVQVVEDEAVLAVQRIDLSALAREAREAEVARIEAGEADAVFDLERAPLVRCAVVRLGPDLWDVFWACHHVMVDGWSFAVIERDLFAFYAAEEDGGAAPSPVAPAFADHLAWIASRDHDAACAWWRERLAGFDTPCLVADGGDRAAPEPGTPVWDEQAEILAPDADRRLRAFAAARGLTLNTLVQTAFALVLARHLRRRDVCSGMVVSGRPAELPGVEEMVGLFINTLPARMRLDPHARVADVLARAQRDLSEMQARSFLSLADVQRLADVPAGAAPFDALVVVQTLPAGGVRPADLSVTADPVSARTDYPLTAIVEVAERTALRFVHDRTRLSAARTRALAAALRAALEALPEAAEGPLGAWPALPSSENPFGLLPTHGPRWADPAALVSARAEETPDATALVFEGETRSYAELEAASNRLAHWLRVRGVGPETVVALALDRSFALVEAMLAVMKAGGAFLPLGLDTPAPRLAGMLEEARPLLVLTTLALAPALPTDGPETVALDDPAAPWADMPTRAPVPVGTPDDAVYVFYTSGSTGRPKGVVNTRRGLANRIAWGQHAYPLTPADRVMQKTPYTFDVSVWEWLWPLTVGATLVIARPDGHRDPAYLADLAERAGVTLMHFVPSMLQVFLDDPARGRRCRALRRIVCSGEAVSGDLRDRCRAHAGVEILNLYGPTEAAIEVSHWQCGPADTGASVPMGVAIDGVVLRVVDTDGHPCAVGVPGELLIGGVAVARGYVARPGLTAERFVPDPMAGRDGVTPPGARVYRTGDLVVRREDGALDYLGRIDWQVKIRGQRVELPEIEAVLRACEDVRDCAIVYRKGEAGDGRLIAYVVGPADEPGSVAALKAALAERLPEVMRPGEWIVLDALPLTPSGKLDRAALPEPGVAARRGGRGGPPTDALSREIASILLKVLGRAEQAPETIGVKDHFTADLGGHSLQVLRTVGRLDLRWPGRVDLAGFLRDPTVAGLARLVSGEAAAAETRSPLVVPLRPDGVGPPLFLIHPALGAVICYIEAARAFPGARPLDAIQAPELAGAEGIDTGDLAALAAAYRAAMRSVQPDGPLAIAGYSYGGLVAFEAARQEAAAGTPPALLAVLDTLAPPAEPSGEAGPGEAALLAELGTILERYAGGTPTLTAEAVAAVPAEERLAFVRRTLEGRGGLDAALDLDATLRATRGAGRARAFYRPGGYDGPLALLRCAAPSAEDLAGTDPAQMDDPALGWGRWVRGPITVDTVPGDHVDLLRGENAARVAAWLARVAG